MKNEITEIQASSQVDLLAIATLSPEKYVAEVYQPFRTKLHALVEASEAAKLSMPDVRTVAGMDVAIKHRAAFRDDVRIAGEKTRVERKAPILDIGKRLDSGYKEVAAEALPHETFWDEMIKVEEGRKEAEKAARIAAERERVESIQKAIQALRDMPLRAVGKSSAEISAIIGNMVGAEPGELFEEFVDEAKLARFEALEKLASAETVQRAVEVEADSRRQAEARVAAEAEDARVAELARLEAIRVENERVAAENARQAAEMVVERQRLADVAAAQQAAAQAAQKEADAKAAVARAEQDRLDAERQAKIDAQLAALAEQERQLAERQAAADARDAEARAQLEREAAHPEALMMDAEFDVAREAERVTAAADDAERSRLQAMTEQAAIDAHAPAADIEMLLDDVDEAEDSLTDGEIINMVAEVFNLIRSDAIDRLQAINFAAARAA